MNRPLILLPPGVQLGGGNTDEALFALKKRFNEATEGFNSGTAVVAPEAELATARTLVEGLEEDARDGAYFEIDAKAAGVLARYIRRLELSVMRHARYTDDGLRLLPP